MGDPFVPDQTDLPPNPGTGAEAQGGRILLVWPLLRPNDENWTSVEFITTFNEPDEVLEPGGEHIFDVMVTANVADTGDRGRSLWASANLLWNGSYSGDITPKAAAGCYFDFDNKPICGSRDAPGKATVAMPPLTPADSGRLESFGVGVAPCPPCKVSYLYEAQQR